MAHTQVLFGIRHAVSKDKRKGSFVKPDLCPPAGTRSSWKFFCSRQGKKESRWNGVIGNMDRKLRRGRAEIRDLGAERFKTLRGGKEQKAFHTGEGLPGPWERGDSVGGLGS